MSDIGIFFGTESGTTRLIAKKIAKKLRDRVDPERVAKPLNINRISAAQLLEFRFLILGTPTYGEGELPGRELRLDNDNWVEFLPNLAGASFANRRVALFGLGDQEEYPGHFLDAMGHLYRFFQAAGAELIGSCPTDGFEFTQSQAVVDGRFVGLAIDHHLQHLLTDARIDAWLDDIVAQIPAPVAPATIA